MGFPFELKIFLTQSVKIGIECHNDYFSGRKERSRAAYEEKAFYGDYYLIQVSLLQVSTVVTFFSEISNLQQQKEVVETFKSLNVYTTVLL